MKTTPQQRQKLDKYWHNGGTRGLITRTALRTLQFVLAIIIAALYGVDLAHSAQTSTHAHSEWIYAEVVACLSALTCVVHCFITVTRVGWCTWDFVLFVLWMAQTGVFGDIYVSSNVRGDYEKATSSLDRMKAGVWISLVCMVLWLGTFVLAVGLCIRTRKVVRRTYQLEVDKRKTTKGIGDEESGYKALDAEQDSETEVRGKSDRDSIKKIGKSEKAGAGSGS